MRDSLSLEIDYHSPPPFANNQQAYKPAGDQKQSAIGRPAVTARKQSAVCCQTGISPVPYSTPSKYQCRRWGYSAGAPSTHKDL